MKDNKPKKKVKAINIIIIFIVIVIAVGVLSFSFLSRPVSSDTTIVPFTVNEGESYSTIGADLEEQGFISSELFYKLMLKTKTLDELYAGTYPLAKSMDIGEIISVISSGQTYEPDAFFLTFREGLNISQYAKLIEENTVHTEEDIYALLSDEDYLDEVIEKYWFITDEVKNPKIYYSLEGYLYPETYQISSKDAPPEEIFTMMLDQTEYILEGYKTDIENSKHNLHEILTLASIIELEAGTSSDRAGVAGVFYNRLDDNWSLGSDVTTYYGARVLMSERDLFMKEINEVNDYNTRSSAMAGKLPVSPICSPSKNSIVACINPTSSDYYYFVADKNGKTYFNKTESEHRNTVSRLKDEGLWFEYE